MSENPSAYKQSTPKAIKVHRCCECRGEIQPGEVYHLLTGVWDGRGMSFKTCSDCEQLRKQLKEDSDLHWDEMPALGQLGSEVEYWHADQFDRIRIKRGLTSAFIALNSAQETAQ